MAFRERLNHDARAVGAVAAAVAADRSFCAAQGTPVGGGEVNPRDRGKVRRPRYDLEVGAQRAAYPHDSPPPAGSTDSLPLSESSNRSSHAMNPTRQIAASRSAGGE